MIFAMHIRSYARPVLLGMTLTTLLLGSALVPTVAGAQELPQSYVTRSGPKTVDQLTLELSTAGYAGPWDPASMLSAYEAAAPKPTPAPAAPPPPAPVVVVQSAPTVKPEVYCTTQATQASAALLPLQIAAARNGTVVDLYGAAYHDCMASFQTAPPAPTTVVSPPAVSKPQYTTKNGLQTVESMRRQLGLDPQASDQTVIDTYARATGAPVAPSGTFTSL